MNSIIRRIDLICKLFAPVITGFIISFVSLTASAMTLVLWNIISVSLEYWLLTSVYNGIPALSESSLRRVSRSWPEHSDLSPSISHEQESSFYSNGIGLDQSENLWRKIVGSISRLPCLSAWKVYLQQDVVLPGLALALLFCTVLSFGTLMTATLEWEGIPACHWNCAWSKRNNRDSCNISLPHLRITYFNTSNRSLVNLVTVDLPVDMCSFYMAP